MADYYPLIVRAVSGLDANTVENRRGIYERARSALTKQLHEVTPPIAEMDIARECLALEQAILRVEAESGFFDPASVKKKNAGEASIEQADAPTKGNRSEPAASIPFSNIFISYRRDDSAGHAGRVHDRLTAEFGKELLFMDVDAIPLGANFITRLTEEVGRCDVLLAVIGPRWLNARDKDGRRRLGDPSDFVRIEISAALRRAIPVVPILLEGVSMPMSADLPSDLAELGARNALDVRHASFHQDMDKLIRFLRNRQTPLK